jgi:hypothetical protein
MQPQTRMWSRLSVLGGVYAALFVVAQVLIGSPPGTGSSTSQLVAYYHSHRAAETVAVFVIALAVVAFTFFLASLRRTLSKTDDGRNLANVVTAGGAVYAVGLSLMAFFTLSLVDAVHNHATSTVQTLNVLTNEAWVPVVLGLSMVGLGTGVAALRSTSLPRWLGWASVVWGVLALAGPIGGIAFLIAPVWALVTGVVLMRSRATREDETVPSVNAFGAAKG